MANSYLMGIDVGGSHITLDLVDDTTFEMLPSSTLRKDLDTNAAPSAVLEVFESAIAECAAFAGKESVRGVGLAIPGPFDYGEGICRITPAQQKYEQMFGVNFRTTLCRVLSPSKPVIFNNDAACFAMGEYFRGGAKGFSKAIIVTLGTGFGASFLDKGRPQTSGEGVTDGGELWNVPWKDGIADDYFSTRWLVAEWKKETGEDIAGGKEIAQAALKGDSIARGIYSRFGTNLAEFIAPWLNGFKANAFVIGGNIARDWDLYVPALEKGLAERLTDPVAVKPCTLGEQAPIYGAALALTMINETDVVPVPLENAFDLTPTLTAARSSKTMVIDGPADTLWKSFAVAVDTELRKTDIKAVWFDITAACTEDDAIDPDQIANIRCDAAAPLSILFGTGAAQAEWGEATLVEL